MAKNNRFARLRLWERMPHVCHWCGVPVTEDTVTLEHLIPVAHGGKTTLDNSVLSCTDCNNMRGKKSVEAWLKCPWLIDRRTRVANGEFVHRMKNTGEKTARGKRRMEYAARRGLTRGDEPMIAHCKVCGDLMDTSEFVEHVKSVHPVEWANRAV